MTPIEVVGDRDTVLAWRLGGVPGRVAQGAEQARAALNAAVAALQVEGARGRQPALLLMTHGAARHIRADLDRVMLDPAGPLVLEIPGFGEPMGEEAIERFVERVLGIHL